MNAHQKDVRFLAEDVHSKESVGQLSHEVQSVRKL